MDLQWLKKKGHFEAQFTFEAGKGSFIVSGSHVQFEHRSPNWQSLATNTKSTLPVIKCIHDHSNFVTFGRQVPTTTHRKINIKAGDKYPI